MADTTARLLDPRAIRLYMWAVDRDDAIRQCGRALVEVGAVTDAYVKSMLERERSVSTYLGEAVAIPHGTAKGKNDVLRDALAVLRFPEGVDWNGHQVNVCVAIAAKGDGHMAILAELAEVLVDPRRAKQLREVATAQDVTRLLQPAESEWRSRA